MASELYRKPHEKWLFGSGQSRDKIKSQVVAHLEALITLGLSFEATCFGNGLGYTVRLKDGT